MIDSKAWGTEMSFRASNDNFPIRKRKVRSRVAPPRHGQALLISAGGSGQSLADLSKAFSSGSFGQHLPKTSQPSGLRSVPVPQGWLKVVQDASPGSTWTAHKSRQAIIKTNPIFLETDAVP